MHTVALAVVMVIASAGAENRKDAAEWTRDLAVYFLDSALAKDYKEALAVTTDEFGRRLILPSYSTGRREADWEERALQKIVWPTGFDAKSPYAVVKRSRLAPAGDEALVFGEVRTGVGPDKQTVAKFSVTLERTPQGKWRVSGLTYTILKL